MKTKYSSNTFLFTYVSNGTSHCNSQIGNTCDKHLRILLKQKSLISHKRVLAYIPVSVWQFHPLEVSVHGGRWVSIYIVTHILVEYRLVNYSYIIVGSRK